MESVVVDAILAIDTSRGLKHDVADAMIRTRSSYAYWYRYYFVSSGRVERAQELN